MNFNLWLIRLRQHILLSKIFIIVGLCVIASLLLKAQAETVSLQKNNTQTQLNNHPNFFLYTTYHNPKNKKGLLYENSFIEIKSNPTLKTGYGRDSLLEIITIDSKF